MSIDLEQRIRERAYAIWERDGRADGRAEEHWHAAKLELTGTVPAVSSDSISVAAKPKARRKATTSVEATTGVSQAAPRRRRSNTTTLPN